MCSSDLEAPFVPPTSLHLHGEHVILIHRPGLDDRTLDSHLARVTAWKEKFRQSGARDVLAIPEAWITPGLLVRTLDGVGGGTAIIILQQSHAMVGLASDSERRDRLRAVATGIADLCATWKPPVTILWYLMSTPAAKMNWMPPLEYQPRLVQRSGEINSLEQLQTYLRETAIGSIHLLDTHPQPETPLTSAIAFTQAPDVLQGKHIALFIISDLMQSDIPTLPQGVRLTDETVSLIYAPSMSDRSNPNRLFDRIGSWKAMLSRIGAKKVCALDVSSLIPAQLKSCEKE